MAQKYVDDSLVMYTAANAVGNHDAVGDVLKFADAAGTPGAPFFAVGSRIVGKVITMTATGYTVQFGPTDAAAAAAALQILNIPEAQLKKITILNDVVVAGVGGSRKKRQSKKKKNSKRNNKNNQ